MSIINTSALLLPILAAPSFAAPNTGEPEWETGKLELASAGALAFGPDGVLFVGDAEGAAVFALKTGDTDVPEEKADLALENIDETLAFVLGTTREQIAIQDLAVNPASGAAYLSVTRGSGNSAQSVIVCVRGPEEIDVLELDDVPHLRAPLENAPKAGGSGRSNRRTQSITDLAFHDGILYVAGLSNEEFASKLRALSFPFGDAGAGSSIEIYHAAHGAWETRSPVRTMVPIDIAGDPNLLCGYTCTPLVKVPVTRITGDAKFVGTTVAELGNRNTPLDMIVYEKDGAGFLLIANTSRGVMKLSTDGLETAEGLTEPADGPKGVGYETLESLQNVTQLAQLDGERALILVEDDAGATLRTIALP
jgi:hypothetical protein